MPDQFDLLEELNPASPEPKAEQEVRETAEAPTRAATAPEPAVGAHRDSREGDDVPPMTAVVRARPTQSSELATNTAVAVPESKQRGPVPRLAQEAAAGEAAPRMKTTSPDTGDRVAAERSEQPGRQSSDGFDTASAAEVRIPIHLVQRCGVRTILPLDPTSSTAIKIADALAQGTYPAIPVREALGKYEALVRHHEVDALIASGADSILAVVVRIDSALDALCYGLRAERTQVGKRRPWEKMRDVASYYLFAKHHSGKWKDVGEIMGLNKTTVSKAKFAGQRITGKVVKRAGVSENDPADAGLLRKLSDLDLSWIAQPESWRARAIRLAILTGKPLPAGTMAEEEAANTPNAPALKRTWTSKRRGGVIVVAATAPIGMTPDERREHLASYEAEIIAADARHHDEAAASADQDSE